MHTFVSPNGYRFHFNSDLSGPVLIDVTALDGTKVHLSIPGDDVGAFIRRIRSEHPGALNEGAEHPLDALADEVHDLKEALAAVVRRLEALEGVHESKRGEHRCPHTGCLLDAGHTAPCRVLGGAPFSAEPEL